MESELSLVILDGYVYAVKKDEVDSLIEDYDRD